MNDDMRIEVESIVLALLLRLVVGSAIGATLGVLAFHYLFT